VHGTGGISSHLSFYSSDYLRSLQNIRPVVEFCHRLEKAWIAVLLTIFIMSVLERQLKELHAFAAFTEKNLPASTPASRRAYDEANPFKKPSKTQREEAKRQVYGNDNPVDNKNLARTKGRQKQHPKKQYCQT
jgi:hypothetical protein